MWVRYLPRWLSTKILPGTIVTLTLMLYFNGFPGFTIGIGLSYPLCGFIIAHYGWRVVFYVTGSFGILWCVVWWFLAFDTPQDHPRITKQELAFIQKCTRSTAVDSKVNQVFLLFHMHIIIHFNSNYDTTYLLALKRQCRFDIYFSPTSKKRVFMWVSFLPFS